MNRTELINYLIKKKSFTKYLEIGTSICTTFDKIKCDKKIGIDPAYNAQVRVDGGIVIKQTSDDFFDVNTNNFQIVFIDGLHLYEQVAKDIINSWNCLERGGFIILHDCMPPSSKAAGRTMPRRGPWTGDTYKAIIWFRDQFPSIQCNVLDTDYGLGFINKKEDNKLFLNSDIYKNGYDYEWLLKNKDRICLTDPKWVFKYLENTND